MQRRESLDSVDSIIREKAETCTTSEPRSALRSALSRAACRISGARKAKQLTAGQADVASGSVHEQEPFQVYIVGDQVVYLGPGSNGSSRKANKEKREAVMNDEMERVKIAKERRLSSGHRDDAGISANARVMRRTG